MQEYFANFIKTGNPNGVGLPEWPAKSKSKPVHVMHIKTDSRAMPDTNSKRYQLMEEVMKR
jgi:para-nitrobenzyl esterase